jgi:putative transposase
LPTEEQKQQLARFFGCARFVYNVGLKAKREEWASARKHLTWIDLANQIKELKDSDYQGLHECPLQILQKSLLNLDSPPKRVRLAFFYGSPLCIFAFGGYV